jgi:mono/diheme cytochrome c family protein
VGGKGDSPKVTMDPKPTDFTDKKKMSGFTDADLKKATLDGKPPMPAYRDKISDKDLDDAITYIRSFAGK